jgi:hypothetical protein
MLNKRQSKIVEFLKRTPDFATMRHLVLSFRSILCGGKVSSMKRWIKEAEAAGIEAMTRFVRQLKKDRAAVENAVEQVWSNGPVEGHINRLKTLKRQMYGRADFELLRARVLPFPLKQGVRAHGAFKVAETAGNIRGGQARQAMVAFYLVPSCPFLSLTSIAAV